MHRESGDGERDGDAVRQELRDLGAVALSTLALLDEVPGVEVSAVEALALLRQAREYLDQAGDRLGAGVDPLRACGAAEAVGVG